MLGEFGDTLVAPSTMHRSQTLHNLTLLAHRLGAVVVRFLLENLHCLQLVLLCHDIPRADEEGSEVEDDGENVKIV